MSQQRRFNRNVARPGIMPFARSNVPSLYNVKSPTANTVVWRVISMLFAYRTILLVFAFAAMPLSIPAQSAESAGSDVPHSDMPLEVQNLRWHMLDPGFNSLAFRSMDILFTTRKVPHSGPAWQLPRADHPLDFTYTFEGKTYRPADFFDRTYTNALLIMKNGVIVS
jgi:hypothetical protein